ncbi:hypothetical protein NL476_28230, partial [Klebsiella pneumoniae]|nr:hypothetical protein [Klebsiella pneumoniae]
MTKIFISSDSLFSHLNTSSNADVNSFGDIVSLCLTPYIILNFPFFVYLYGRFSISMNIPKSFQFLDLSMHLIPLKN